MSKEQSWARGRTNGVTTPMCSGKIDKITTLTKAQSSRIVSLRSTPRTRHCPALPTRFDPFGVRGVVQRVRTERIAPGTSRGYSSRRSGLKRALRPGHWPGASPCWAPSEQLRAGSLPPGGGRAMPDDQLAGDGPFVVRAVTTSRSRRPPGRVPGSVIQRSWVVANCAPSGPTKASRPFHSSGWRIVVVRHPKLDWKPGRTGNGRGRDPRDAGNGRLNTHDPHPPV